MPKLQKSQSSKKTITITFRIPIDLAARMEKIAPPTNHIGQAQIRTRNLEIVRLLYRWVEREEGKRSAEIARDSHRQEPHP